MQTGRYLTIQDYFKRANVSRRSVALRQEPTVGLQPGQNGFANSLEAAQASLSKQSSGRTIQDYIKNPVRMRPKVRITPIPDLPEAHPTSTAVKDQMPAAKSHSDLAAAERAAAEPQCATRQIDAGVSQAAAKYDLPPGLIHAVIRAESNYQVDAVSRAGAQGLMQLMPATARELGVQDPFDVGQNIDGGSKYLRQMLDRFNGDLELALSAYNAGPGNVDKYNGRVPFAETRNYVARVLRFAKQT